MITFGIVIYLILCIFINREMLIYYSFWIVSKCLKIIKPLSDEVKKISFKSVLGNIYSEVPNIFMINSHEKLMGIIILILIFIIRTLSLGSLYRFLIIALIIYLFINILMRCLKEMDSVLRFLVGQIMVPCILIIFYIEILQRQIQSVNFKIELFLLMLLTLIFWQYISIKIYYYENTKIFQRLNLIICYVQIIITTLLLFIVIGIGFALYNANILDINPNKAILNISGHENAYNLIIALVAYAVDNLTNEIGIAVVKNTTNGLVDINKVIFSILSKVFVSVYAVLILSFVSNTLFNKNNINSN